MSDSDKHSIKLEDEEPQDIQIEQENELNNLNSNNEMADLYENNDGQQIRDTANYIHLGTQPNLNKKRTHRKLEISNFIMKTYKILEDKRNSHIVEWTDQGNCFIVKDKQRFSREILPKFFKHSKFSSFVRQLNMYDFHKIRKEKQIPIFKHRYFKMGCLDLLHKIKRKSGDEGKEQEAVSKELVNPSENIISLSGIDNFSSKQSIIMKSASKQSGQLSIQGQIELLKKENNELRHSLSEISQDINELEMNREKKKEKLVKIITSLIFFDLNKSESSEPSGEISLRKLQEHLVSEEEPLSFSEYRGKLGEIYFMFKNSLI